MTKTLRGLLLVVFVACGTVMLYAQEAAVWTRGLNLLAGNLTLSNGSVVVAGSAGGTIIFEGATANASETTIAVTDPTADRTWTIPDSASDTFVGLAATQTLTNKTFTSGVLTTPQINDTSSDHQYVFVASELAADRNVTLPLLASADTFVFADFIQTLTNKTLTSPVLTTPQINDTSSDHQYVFVASELSADRNVTLPLLTGADTFVFADFIQTLTNKTLTAPTLTSPVITGDAATGVMITKIVTFTENATNATHTGTVVIPAGATVHSVKVISSVLWGDTAAVMKVGDTADDDGYFVGIDLDATDLLVGEVLDTADSVMWGGKEGAYLVLATGQRGPQATNFGMYYGAGSNIVGVVTVTTPSATAGRTFMIVTYSVGQVTAAVVSG